MELSYTFNNLVLLPSTAVVKNNMNTIQQLNKKWSIMPMTLVKLFISLRSLCSKFWIKGKEKFSMVMTIGKRKLKKMPSKDFKFYFSSPLKWILSEKPQKQFQTISFIMMENQ